MNRMMPRTISFCAWLILMTLSFACREPGSGMVHCWQVNQIRRESSGFMVAFPDFNDPATLKDCFLRFYADSSVAVWQKRQGYSLHRWVYSEEQESYRLINPETGTELHFRVADREGSSIKLAQLTEEQRETGLYLMLSMTQVYEDAQTDLLHPDQNAWRFPPKRPENPAEIKKRALAMLDYVIDYFELVERRRQAIVETSILQSPFRFYNHGIGLTSEKGLPPNWVATYFNQHQAAEAYRMLVKAFYRSGAYPKGVKRHTAAYLKVLYEVRDNLKK